MTVELLVCIPVALVLLLVVVNAFMFLSYCSRFDALATWSTISATMDTSRADTQSTLAPQIHSELKRSLGGGDRVKVRVSETESGAILSFLGDFKTYTIGMDYTPWPAPRSFSIVGFSTGRIGILHKEKTFTVESGSPEVLF